MTGYKKYNNKKTYVDGIKFDSKGEANRYKELKLLEKAGEIKDLELQPKFTLIPKNKGNRAVTYTADFKYIENGKTIIEDYKGYETKEFKLKKKMFEYFYENLELRIVK